MKIAVMSDLHLGMRQYGLHEREEDFYDQYNKVVNGIIQCKPDVVIIGGDIFDKPRPSPRALRVFSEGLTEMIQNDIKVVNIMGNHTMVKQDGFVTADEFFDGIINTSNGYTLLDIDNNYSSNGVSIFGLPYHYDSELDSFVEKVNHLNEESGNAKTDVNILVVHQAFSEFCGFAGTDLSINDICIDNFDLIVCGHIHERKVYQVTDKTTFLQPGSIERLNVAEARDEEIQGKGFYLLDTDMLDSNSVAEHFIRIKSDRKFFIADMYMGDNDSVDDIKKEILDGIVGCTVPPIVFLTVHDTSQSFSKLIDMTHDLNSDCLTVRLKYFDESQEEYNIISDASELPTPDQALKIALNPLDKDEARFGLDLYRELQDGKDVQKLLDDFYKKTYNNDVEPDPILYTDEEIRELESYFDNL